jgi:hypothetical protein
MSASVDQGGRASSSHEHAWARVGGREGAGARFRREDRGVVPDRLPHQDDDGEPEPARDGNPSDAAAARGGGADTQGPRAGSQRRSDPVSSIGRRVVRSGWGSS